jgi:hypothetical protein
VSAPVRSARVHGLVAGSEDFRALSLLLADLYGSCPVPASWPYYRAAVLDEALRRRCAEMAVRVGQCAEGDSLDTLIALVGTEIVEVRSVHQRRTALEAVTSG